MGWFWGEQGESCDATCARYGQICDTDWTRDKVLLDMQTYEAFAAAGAQADHNSELQFDLAGNPDCNEGTFETESTSPWPGVVLTPDYRCGTSGTCQGQASCGGEVGTPYGYACGASVPGMHRMCYCLPGALAIEPHISA